MKDNFHSLRSLLAVVAVLAGVPAALAPLHAQEAEGAVADAKAAALKAMLQHLDDQIDRIEEFLENAPTPQDKAAAKARLEKLKERRSELRKNYAQARFDALKADVQTEYNKLSLWAKKTFSTSPEAQLDRKLDAAADAKVALTLLDTEIKLYEARCDKLPKGAAHDASKLRLKAFKARRAELAASFDRARYDELLSDVRTETRKITD